MSFNVALRKLVLLDPLGPKTIIFSLCVRRVSRMLRDIRVCWVWTKAVSSSLNGRTVSLRSGVTITPSLRVELSNIQSNRALREKYCFFSKSYFTNRSIFLRSSCAVNIFKVTANA